ncbi:hypothetical protein [Candidatus Phytoplasma oryzae]|nr:hypothetical protein PIE28_01840 [Candidatus Phytoplasma oryzae]
MSRYRYRLIRRTTRRKPFLEKLFWRLMIVIGLVTIVYILYGKFGSGQTTVIAKFNKAVDNYFIRGKSE